MDNQLLRAKELFTSYHGSTLHMYREGDLEEYREYNIPKDMEIEWFKEMIDQYTRELSIRDWNAVEHLDLIADHYPDASILKNIESFASRNVMSSDSIVKLMFAEKMIDIIKKTKKHIPEELLIEAYKTTYIILNEIMNKPLIIDPGHELEQYNLKDKKSLNNRAKRSIENLKNELN
ncbi:hypothetical protein BVG16_27435 [Paenibacillus selenitireducens]|uniref:Uncharacterized protein n=1 Tax=Paenibacillus selenitireducens TaxID=1324314 RepID=A0A1T2X2L1_9BACL|nr:hypothetical protein [Paenibacillus selenitireducens]OPA73813.1 hypothetical protein BVG16_27435 [Paenibacillus selenitireducens]